MKNRIYLCIDLKSFYASVECIERGLDPMTTNLVVADASRTEKTICLAVSPALKSYGIPGRARLFEVIQKVKQANEKSALDQRILLLQDHLKELPEVIITYFEPDERKSGGKYISKTGAVKKIDAYEKQIVLADRSKISIENILSIEGELFRILEMDN